MVVPKGAHLWTEEISWAISGRGVVEGRERRQNRYHRKFESAVAANVGSKSEQKKRRDKKKKICEKKERFLWILRIGGGGGDK